MLPQPTTITAFRCGHVVCGGCYVSIQSSHEYKDGHSITNRKPCPLCRAPTIPLVYVPPLDTTTTNPPPSNAMDVVDLINHSDDDHHHPLNSEDLTALGQDPVYYSPLPDFPTQEELLENDEAVMLRAITDL